MSLGLLGLLDDVAASASIDDVAGQAVKAGVKAAGVVIDDAAVTPRYVIDPLAIILRRSKMKRSQVPFAPTSFFPLKSWPSPLRRCRQGPF